MREIRWAAVVAAAGLVALVVCAASGSRNVTLLAAAATGMLLAGAAMLANWRLCWQARSIAAAKQAAVLNASLMAVVYGWGALAIAGMYYLSDLSWYHAYQYALYLAVPAALSAFYARRIETIDITGRTRPLRTGQALAGVQLLAMAAVIAILVATGKAPGTRPDWAANTIFLSGAAALIVVSALALAAQRRLRPSDQRLSA